MSNNESRPLIRRHMALEELLQLATPDELSAITRILLNKENNRVLGDASMRQRLARSQAQGELYKVVSEIAFEIRALGSASLASLLRRGEPVRYDEVVHDVASQLKIKYNKTDTTSSIEEKILEVLVDKLAKQTGRDSQTAAGFTIAGSALGAAALLTALPLAAVGAVATSVLAARHKARPELSGLTMIVVYIARIRVGVVAADHEDFVDRLRACL